MMCVRSMVIAAILFAALNVQAAVEAGGQASTYAALNLDRSAGWQAGLRYIPYLKATLQCTGFTLDGEISVNLSGWASFDRWDLTDDATSIDLYRGWARFSTAHFEARVGMQKINFGPAVLMRSLMWFDRLDPRDPLQMTNGVNGILLRYTALNNANLWGWGLFCNDGLKGLEALHTVRKDPEFGGRFQFPLLSGETGLTFHHRRVDLERGILGVPLGSGSEAENRLAMDGRWDAFVGFWFEAALIHAAMPDPFPSFQRFLTLGLDYTFGLGNGLHVLHELFQFRAAECWTAKGEGLTFSALMMGYPLGMLDMITGMVYYDWDNRDWYRFVSFQRTLDQWQFFLMGFWNPAVLAIYGLEGNSLFAGKGIQIQIVFNH